jgi:hypothetical protein
MMRPWDDASLWRFPPCGFVTICPQFSGRTIHPHFGNFENFSLFEIESEFFFWISIQQRPVDCSAHYLAAMPANIFYLSIRIITKNRCAIFSSEYSSGFPTHNHCVGFLILI